IWYQPPSSLISVKVDEPTVIRAAFDIQVLPGYAENTEHYYLREKESGTEVPITNAELSEDYYTVTLTLGSEMTPEIVHTLAALDVYNSLGGNSCIPDPTGGCMYPSTFDFTLIPIAVYLQGFDVACVPAGVELTWRLSRLEEDVHFSVLRRFAAGSAYVQLPNDDILRDDLTFTFVDDEVELGESYVYRVDYVLGEETGLLFETEAVQTPVLPLTLHQNVPNPFNPVTEISYYLPTAGDVLLEVYDVAGKRIATLVRGREEKGRHIVNWQGADDTGRAIASGIYFYRLRAGKEVISKKMVFLR
ncbi:MAG: T9SS type A sorting domain-containing protein, partial [Candidatus Krumholzibacteria bacterium]|nr:T9SS type A sorting domain-containing protein [Candidatus Krumholzibacteria bacterium]